jgi:hypothetical protein
LFNIEQNTAKLLYNSYLSTSSFTNLNLSFSGNSRFLSFASAKAGIVTNDSNGNTDVFLYDSATEALKLVSANNRGDAANEASLQPIVSYNGKSIVFESVASDLVENDQNNSSDIFTYSIPVQDSDADGMDDGDELLTFGSLEHSGDEDSDNDGASDWAELQAGTNPNGEGSFLGLNAKQGMGGTGTIQWQSIPGRTYQLQTKSSLDSVEWNDFGMPIVAVATTTSTSFNPVNQTGVYRIVLR